MPPIQVALLRIRHMGWSSADDRPGSRRSHNMRDTQVSQLIHLIQTNQNGSPSDGAPEPRGLQGRK